MVYFLFLGLHPNNQTTDTASNLIAGTYLITVTDQNGCSLDSNVIVSQPDSLISRHSKR